MKSFKYSDLDLLKVGRVSKHSIKIRSKIYNKEKVYLSDNVFTNKGYELYYLDDLLMLVEILRL